MMDNIFSSIISFPLCQSALEESKKKMYDGEKNKCQKVNINYFTTSNSSDRNICPISLSYLDHINRHRYDFTNEEACYYLYYWIYQELKYNFETGKIKKIYDEIVDLYSEDPNNAIICKTYNITRGTEDKIDDVKYLYEISRCLKITKYNDKTNVNSEFCNTLLNKINEYNEMNRNIDNDPKTQEITQPYRNDIRSAIIIPILVALIITLLFFIAYKFYPLYSRFLYQIKYKLNKIHNTDEERNMLEESEQLSIMACNNRYNMLYCTD
ncbi:variable surface protein [Plasmodium gonderi]|uniref:Variable surface protein n=1 Tax=Plasmodium gonderi TaxID=77519 RepID=A0A1Y1JLC6_PLAGO|nr:variable surface protein [Plasmodium gonderi]GAW82017.1 variable surface protein [Plasmodium gonderi]